MNDNKRKLYDRIGKLLRLAGDNRTNAHEANLARNIALNLLRKNGITLSTDENETTENELILRQKWVSNLIKYPKLADICPVWDKFGTWDWAYILEKQPQFAERCPCFNKFDHNQWRFLIVSQVSLATYCKTWGAFDERDWTRILRAHPELFRYKNPSLE